jgi:predicted outer membrane lipoprotein
MNVLLWIVQVLLAAMFMYSGVLKAFEYEHARPLYSG